MLKPILAGTAVLALSVSAFAQSGPANKPLVFITSVGQSDPVSTVSSAGDTAAQLAPECPSVQLAAREIGADYTLRVFTLNNAKNQYEVANSVGTVVASGVAGSVKETFKEVCPLIRSDFGANGKSPQPVLAPESSASPIPSFGSAAPSTVPAKATPAVTPPAGAYGVTVSDSAPSASTIPVTNSTAVQPAIAPVRGTTASQSAEPIAQQQGAQSLPAIHGATVSASSTQQASSMTQVSAAPQTEALSLGEIARRNRAAKAAREKQQQAQDTSSNQAPQ